MKLHAQILNGKRLNERILLPLDSEQPLNPPPYILETEAFSLNLICDRPLQSVEVIVEEVSYSMAEQYSNSSSYQYCLMPVRNYRNQFEALFYNYFGMASIFLKVIENNIEELYEVRPFEVLARKLSADQAERMMSFILSESSDELQNVIGATRFGADPDAAGDQPNKLLEQLKSHIGLLEEVTPFIVNRPLSALQSRLTLIDGNCVDAIDEDGMSWLIENLSVLDTTDDPYQAHLKIDNEFYQASEIQSHAVTDETDIVENRIVHGYLASLSAFIHEMQSGFDNVEAPSTSNYHKGYVSFFDTMKAWVAQLSARKVAELEVCRRRLDHLRSVYERYVPVKQIYPATVQFTQRVKSNVHYSTLFKSIALWQQRNRIDWRTKQMLLAISSLPKLWELYTVIRTLRWCKSISDPHIAPLEGAIWSGNTAPGEWEVYMHYEPTYWMAQHHNAGRIVNTELRTASTSRSDSSSKNRSGKFQKREPDIVLEFVLGLEYTFLIVMDAKYTKRDLAFSERLPEMVMKYVHGLAHEDHGSIVNSMIILYPDSDDQFMDYHAYPYCLNAPKTQWPVLGCQAMSINHGEDLNNWKFEQTLELIFKASTGYNMNALGRKSYLSGGGE